MTKSFSDIIDEEFNLFYDEMLRKVPEIAGIHKAVLRSFFTHGGFVASKLHDDLTRNQETDDGLQ